MAISYLQGNLAPVPDEIDALDLEVSGTLPPELTGRYFRNGPNPLPGHDPGHWFAGDGMIHGIRLREGRAEWYRNRWVRTRKLDGAQFLGPQGIDLTAVPANTHVIHHADKILALVENGLPYEMTPDLDTVGPCDFGGRLTTAMTAHPKEDPLTGELHFFGYGFVAPYLTYHRLTEEGTLVESREIPVPGPTMMHDFAITQHHVVWLDLPVVFDMTRVGKRLPFGWDDAYGARIGVMPRQHGGASTVESTGGAGGSGDPKDVAGMVRWFDIDPCYIFHVGNAREDEQGRIVIDAVRYAPDVFVGVWDVISGSTNPAAEAGGARLYRWVLDPATGTVKEEPLDELTVEFPTIDDRRTGHPNDHLYAVTDAGIVKYDLRSGRSLIHPTAARADEAIFVPRGSAADDDGWLLSIVGSQAELLVLDAADLTQVASVRLPRRVPAGFHGSWIADEPQ